MPHDVSIDPGKRQPHVASRMANRRWSLLIGGLLILLQGCATTPSVSPSEEARIQAKIAYLLSDYQRTLLIALPRAEAGEPWAEYTVGYLYYYGRGVAQNKDTGKRWIARAAAKGYEPARLAMQRLSAPPAKTDTEGVGTSTGKPAAGAEQTPPATPATKEPATAPPAPATPPAKPPAPLMPTPVPNATPTAPAPNEQQPAAPSAPPADSMPPQTSVAPPVNQANVRPPISSPNKDIKGSAWITDQDPRHFTLQLISSNDEAAVAHFIHVEGIEHQAAYYATVQNGTKWYSVVYGSFPNRTAAHHALSRLPHSLRRHAPRIRRFQTIISQLE